MLPAAEVLRRLRALMALPEERRPLSIYQLAKASGESPGDLRKLAHGIRVMGKTPTRRLSPVFEMLEQGRLYVVEEGTRRKHVLVRTEAVPAQAVRRILQMTPEGPRLQLEAVNPNAFPAPPPLFRHKMGR